MAERGSASVNPPHFCCLAVLWRRGLSVARGFRRRFFGLMLAPPEDAEPFIQLGAFKPVGTESPGDADCGAPPPPITPRTMSTPPAVGVAASSSAPFFNKSLKLLAMVAKRRRPWPTPHHRMVGGCSPAGLRLTGVRSGLIKHVSQAPWPGLSGSVEVGGIAPFPCPKSGFPHPIST